MAGWVAGVVVVVIVIVFTVTAVVTVAVIIACRLRMKHQTPLEGVLGYNSMQVLHILVYMLYCVHLYM